MKNSIAILVNSSNKFYAYVGKTDLKPGRYWCAWNFCYDEIGGKTCPVNAFELRLTRSKKIIEKNKELIFSSNNCAEFQNGWRDGWFLLEEDDQNRFERRKTVIQFFNGLTDDHKKKIAKIKN